MSLFRHAALLFALFLTAPLLSAATPPSQGHKAPDFALPDMHGNTVRLSQVTASGPVALIVLRGYPGYQCPYCTRQVQDFIAHAGEFQKAGVEVVFVYPGPSDTSTGLKAKAAESAAGKVLPPHFRMLLDPGYDFTNLYGLRWDAPKETAFPSTFLMDRKGVIYSKVSKAHGDRASAAEVIEALARHAAVR